MRILVVAHVFYAEMWPELSACIRNVGDCDLVITYIEEPSVIAARADFPHARFVRCENRGYDVLPFLTVLESVRLSDYDLVVKLHTKRDIVKPYRFAMGRTVLNGSAWRGHLLSFVRTPLAWERTLRCFDDPAVGMVADVHLVFGRRETDKSAFDASVAQLRDDLGLSASRRGTFVAGTMFAVRAAMLRPFAEHRFELAEFAASADRDPITYAHLLERMFGLAVGAQGGRIVAFNGSVACRRTLGAVLKFCYDNRRSERRHSVRVLGITVYRRKLA